MSWVNKFHRVANLISSFSKDPSTQVGAVAFDHSNRIIETGYNGLPRNVVDLPERMERPQKYLWTAHAEENLVAHAARSRLEGTTVVVTHFPCARCARMLINAGVAMVIYREQATAMDNEEFVVARQMFKEANIVISQLEKESL